MSPRSPLPNESRRPPGWPALAALCLLGAACGGKAEDTQASSDGAKADDVPPPECICPKNVKYGVWLQGPEGESDSYLLPNPQDEWQCRTPSVPGMIDGDCGEHVTIHACSETDGCISVGVSEGNRSLSLSAEDAIRFVDEPSAESSFEISGPVVRGSFVFNEGGEPRWRGTFVACAFSAKTDCSN